MVDNFSDVSVTKIRRYGDTHIHNLNSCSSQLKTFTKRVNSKYKYTYLHQSLIYFPNYLMLGETNLISWCTGGRAMKIGSVGRQNKIKNFQVQPKDRKNCEPTLSMYVHLYFRYAKFLVNNIILWLAYDRKNRVIKWQFIGMRIKLPFHNTTYMFPNKSTKSINFLLYVP